MPNVNLEDTITAIATPPGEGGIAVIRLSGPESFSIAEKVFKPAKGNISDFNTHTIHFGSVINPKGEVMDQAYISLFRNPKSYTGEDVAELSIHGGFVLSRQVLHLIIEAGARHAEPGEFTKRAFLNKKIDLAQAEAVLDLIKSKSEKSAKVAIQQLSGTLSRRIALMKDQLMKMYAHMETFLDFPDEDVEVYNDTQFQEKFGVIQKEIQGLLDGFQRSILIREGLSVVLVGRPNVGKSSLFNKLLERDRALVSAFPGTTRDTLEEAIELEGFLIRLIDTAGIQSTQDPVEKMGIEKTKQALKQGDLFVFLVDGSQGFDEADQKAFESIPKDRAALVCVNKSDLENKLDLKEVSTLTKQSDKEFLRISTKTGKGLDAFEKSLIQKMNQGSCESDREQITRLRHKNALEKALTSLIAAEKAFYKKESLEFVIEDIKASLQEMQELMGEVYSEDLLDVVFAEFCIGK